MFQFPDVENPKRNIDIVIEEKYANILGEYLYGEQWYGKFNDTDRQWVLYLYSPKISEKFSKVSEQTEGNFLEQRRLTYYALTNPLPSDILPYYTGEAKKFLDSYNYGAQLKQNNSSNQLGLTVYLYEYENGKPVINSEPIQYDYHPLIDYTDLNYPVDIKLWDKDNNKPSLGKLYYGDLDFRGKYMEGSVAATLPTGAGGVIAGRMRGFGYLEYGYIGVAGTFTYTLEISGEFGLVDGVYVGSGIPTPVNFCGPGTNITWSTGPIGFAKSNWKGFNRFNIKTWEGISVGIDISFELKETILPASINHMKVETSLVFPSPEKTDINTLKLLKTNEYYEK